MLTVDRTDELTNETEIIIQENEIKISNFDMYIDVINEIITEIAIETEAYIPTIIEDIAIFYTIPSKRLIASLKTINSPFTENNNVVYYFNGLPVRRTAYTCAQRKLLMKLGEVLKKTYTGVEDATAHFMNNIQILLSSNAPIIT